MFYLAERAEIEYEQGRWVAQPRWINTDRLSYVGYLEGAAHFLMDDLDLSDGVVLTNRFRIQMDYNEFINLVL